jgi:hypothetical protein
MDWQFDGYEMTRLHVWSKTDANLLSECIFFSHLSFGGSLLPSHP